MDKLLTLLTLQRQAQEAQTRAQFLHVIANESRKLIPYRQMFIWSDHGISVSLDKVSGNVLLDENSEAAVNLKTLIRSQNFEAHEPLEVEKKDSQSILTMMPISTHQDGLLGGLCLETEKSLSAEEREILKELAFSYAPVFALHSIRGGSGFLRYISVFAKRKKFILIGICALALFPTRLTMTSPFEIVPKEAEIVTIPFNGTLSKIEVDPGQSVKAGDILARMDATSLKAEAEMAGEDLKISSSELSKARREALMMPDKKSDLGTLEAQISEKEIKYRYASDMEEKGTITARRAGTVIFPDKSDLEGKPVQTGDVVMKVADPDEYEALIRIPIASLIPFDEEAALSFYLNVRPTTEYEGEIKSIGYEATPDPDGMLTYKVRADVKDEDLRIGWQGTAKIKGQWTIMAYALLRRPILSLRQITGF